MSRLPVGALTVAGQHNGVVTWYELRDVGLSPRQIDGLVASGFLRRLYVGIYAVVGSTDNELQRLTALCARFKRALVARTAAARLWNVRGLSPHGLELLVPAGLHIVASDVIVYRSRTIDPIDVVSRSDGIRLTSPARTLFDLADVVSEVQLETMIEQCLRAQLVSRTALEQVAQRLATRGRPGSTRFRAVVERWSGTSGPTESDLELHFLLGLRAAGLLEPVCQARLVLPNGRSV